jgi:hypothetical protein
MVHRKQFDQCLEQFRLAQHGDRSERELWPWVAATFPNYERFWRCYVVPLTRRIEPAVQHSLTLPVNSHIIRLRPQAKRFEKLAMSHYSTFFYFGHATRILKTTADYELLANMVFFFLDTSIDNLEEFLKETERFLADCGTKIRFGQPRNDNESIQKIGKYRDTLAHNPVIGRAFDQGLEKLPINSVLEKVKNSWMEAEKLQPPEMAESKQLIEELRIGFGSYLNDTWADLLEQVDRKRNKYLELISLPECDWAPASTTFSPTASDNISFSSSVNPKY